VIVMYVALYLSYGKKKEGKKEETRWRSTGVMFSGDPCGAA
jgi:hypothetical protein